MTYKLFLDDKRPLNIAEEDNSTWVVCRSSDEALFVIAQMGFPEFMALDHDLGGEDTVMKFLHELYNRYPLPSKIPDYMIHSNNPEGAKNIDSFLRGWKQSLE